jgi:hypothetical protein
LTESELEETMKILYENDRYLYDCLCIHLINKDKEIEKSYSKGYAMAKFDCASELLNDENDRRELIDQWYTVATNINKKQ